MPASLKFRYHNAEYSLNYVAHVVISACLTVEDILYMYTSFKSTCLSLPKSSS